MIKCEKIELFVLDRNTSDHLTVSKQMDFGPFEKNVT